MSQPESVTPAEGHASELEALRRENAALRERVDLLAGVVSHSPAVIFVKDSAGRLTLCNRGYDRLFPGLSGRLVGMTDAEIYGEPAAAKIRENDRRVRDGGVPQEFEEFIPTPDGPRTFLTIKFPLYDRAGAPTGIAGIATDITERKRAEQDRAALQQQIIEVQRSTLSELSTPIVPLADGVIAMPLVGAIDRERAQQIMQALLDGLASSRARTAILDVTGVRAVDSQVAGALLQAARAARLLGARVLLSGIRAEVARALVELGAEWSDVETVADLQAAVARALGSPRR